MHTFNMPIMALLVGLLVLAAVVVLGRGAWPSEPPLKPGAFVAIYWTEWPPNPDVLWLREHTTGPKE